MKKTALILPFIILLGGCWPFAKAPMPDKRAGIPGSAQVNNYLEQAVTPQSVHCLDDQASVPTGEKTFFHNDYAKISTNLVGGDTSYRWDDSFNKAIGDSLEKDHPEFLNDKLPLKDNDLASLGCRGFSSASKKDKKRFWALFLATIARSQSGFDPSFKGGGENGLFGLDPAKVGPIGGACAGKDEWDFMEPSYSFGCVLDILKKQVGQTGSLFSSDNKSILGALSFEKRGEFFKFFKAHAAPQFSFCTVDFKAPGALVNSNIEGEKVSTECNTESVDRVYEGLDRSEVKGQKEIGEAAANPGKNASDAAKAKAVEESRKTEGSKSISK